MNWANETLVRFREEAVNYNLQEGRRLTEPLHAIYCILSQHH